MKNSLSLIKQLLLLALSLYIFSFSPSAYAGSEHANAADLGYPTALRTSSATRGVSRPPSAPKSWSPSDIGAEGQNANTTRGLQLLPGAVRAWPVAYTSDTSPLKGIYGIPVFSMIMTNHSLASKGQFGSGIVPSWQYVAVVRRDGVVLLMAPHGEAMAAFDLARQNYQVWPEPARDTAQLNGDTLTISFIGSDTLRFSKVTQNYRGEPVYLLSSYTTPGGKRSEIAYTFDRAAQLPVYTKVGDYTVTGSAESGSVRITHSAIPADQINYLYSSSGQLKTVTGVIQDLLLELSYDGTTTEIKDKYGYKKSFGLDAAGRLAFSCTHTQACIRYTYGADTLVTQPNFSKYAQTVVYNRATGLPEAVSDGEWSIKLSYQRRTDLRFTPYLVSRADYRSGSGIGIVQEHSYDDFGRLTTSVDSRGYVTSFTYVSPSSFGFNEPVAVKTTLQGNLISDQQVSYTENGLVASTKDNLAKPGSGDYSVSLTYNERGQVVSLQRDDGTVQQYTYDKDFPDNLAQATVNGYGFSQRFNPQGLTIAQSSIPAGEALEMQRATSGRVTRYARSVPQQGYQSTVDLSYVAGISPYVATVQKTRTAQGQSVVLSKTSYTWDSLYRNPVAKKESFPAKDPDNARDLLALVSDAKEVAPATSTENAATQPPKGARGDATQCSACTTDQWRGGEGDLQTTGCVHCDPNMRVVVPPQSTSAPGM